MPTIQNAHVACVFRAVRQLKASGRIRDTVVGQYGGLSHCWPQVFSSSCDATMAMNHVPASSIVDDTFKILIHNIEDTPQPPAERLNRLENIVEQHGRSLASLTSQLEEQKHLFASILQDIEVLKSSKDQHLSVPSHAENALHSLHVSASSSIHLCAHPWPQWTSFLQHLKGLPFFKELGGIADFGGHTTFDDPTTAKRMLAKFSEAYEHIFNSLSVTHLKILAVHGCPNDDRRALASGNRLRNHFQIEEKSNSHDSKPANSKLSDVMRLIYTIAEAARKNRTPDELKFSILHLLEEMISMTSNYKQYKIVESEISKDSGSVSQGPLKGKSETVAAKTGVEGSGSLHDLEILPQNDKWKCPRCSCINRQSKSKCMECSFQCIEKRALDIDNMMRKSTAVSTNRIDMRVFASGEEIKEKIISASKKYIVLDEARQFVTTDRLREQGMENVSGGFLAAQEQEGLQKCTSSEEDERNLGGAGLIDGNDADEHMDIFDDIFDSDDASSSKAKQNTFMNFSLSYLVRQNKKAFCSSKRESGGAIGADDCERTGLRPSHGKGLKPDDLGVSTRCTSYRTERDDSVMEPVDKGVVPHRSGGRWIGAGSISGIKYNQSYDYKAGMGSSGRTSGDDIPRSQGRQHYNREGYADADFEEGRRYSSLKMIGKEGPRYKEGKARGAYAKESRGCGSWKNEVEVSRSMGNEGKSKEKHGDEGKSRY